jgi:hypothetical protein
VTTGRGEPGVSVWTPLEGIWNSIRSNPLLAFAFRIAWRKLPPPESSVLATWYSAAHAGPARQAKHAIASADVLSRQDLMTALLGFRS